MFFSFSLTLLGNFRDSLFKIPGASEVGKSTLWGFWKANDRRPTIADFPHHPRFEKKRISPVEKLQI